MMACQEAGVQVDDPSNMYPHFQTSIAEVISRRVFKPSNFTVRYVEEATTCLDISNKCHSATNFKIRPESGFVKFVLLRQ